VKAEKAETLTTFGQVDDPRLRRLRLRPETGQNRCQRDRRFLGVPLAATQHDQVIAIL
jgi:hypothetical protein